MASTDSRNDPYAGFNYIVELDNEGDAVAGFSEVSGLGTETDPIEYRNGDEENTVRKLPGLKKFTNISLKRGFTDSKELWNWRKTVMDGQTERKGGSIVLRNEAGEEALRYTFREGWPCKWEGPSLNAKNNEVAIETLEICHEGLILEE